MPHRGPEPAGWQVGGRWFSHRGHRVFYRVEGQGPPLVCIHGFPTASWDWHRIWPVLCTRFRVIAPDMLGFGFSDKPRRYAYTIAGQATLHEALLEALGCREVHVLAHDYGDTVAQELLARQAEGRARLQLRSVCLLNGGLFPEATRPRPIQRLLQKPGIGPLLGRLLSERRFRKSFSAVFAPHTRPTDDELRAFWALVSHNRGTHVVHRVIQYMAERRRFRERWVGALQRTGVPLRLISGGRDPVSGAPTARRYRELVPNPDVVLLPQAGHYPQLEDPEGVLRAFLAFIDAHNGPASIKSL